MLRTRSVDLPVVMGIVNVTPDSFSDGGRYVEVSAAVDRARRLVEDGAGILDIGGESTRPGADGVTAGEECRRVVPIVIAIREKLPNTPISVDTSKAVVAAEALAAGAEIVNDVSSGADPGMLPLVRDTGAAFCIMHGRGTPKTMQLDPRYDDVVEEVFEYLRRRREELIRFGIDARRIAVDPGLGFGKTTEHNRTLVEKMERFRDLGATLLVGHSRKRFIAETYGDREEGTRIVSRRLSAAGVDVIRVHEVCR